MKDRKTSPASGTVLGRRRFLKSSLGASLTAPLAMSLEEHRLLAGPAEGAASGLKPVGPVAPAERIPCGKIGRATISRLICGGNLISGYAHSRDLIYVSTLLKHYFDDERIMDTWARCEAYGINTMVASSSDPHALEVYRKYRARGGRMQYFAQLGPPKNDLETLVKVSADAGATGAFLVGNLGDLWTRDGSVGLIGRFLEIAKSAGLLAGVAGHELRTVQAVERAGFEPDYYVKTLHDENYWSKRQPGQTQEVIDNYAADNYWCREPAETIRYMSEVNRPWIAYKVLAAGAIHPRAGFRHAFLNGADFALVGMFDFQVEEDVRIAREILGTRLERQRDWMG